MYHKCKKAFKQNKTTLKRKKDVTRIFKNVKKTLYIYVIYSLWCRFGVSDQV